LDEVDSQRFPCPIPMERGLLHEMVPMKEESVTKISHPNYNDAKLKGINGVGETRLMF